MDRDDEDENFKAEGNQPVRLIRFPKGLNETLKGFPKHVGRAAMTRLERLAAGEPVAFPGIKQLKAYPGALRARVADKYRLLFLLEADRVRGGRFDSPARSRPANRAVAGGGVGAVTSRVF